MDARSVSIEDQMRAALPDLTRAERQLATHILSHYPVSALGSITALARAAEVSTPTVVRLVQKLGFRGYPDYQSALRAEVEALLVSPGARSDRRNGRDGHILDRFAGTALSNLEATLAQLDRDGFDAVADLLADATRSVYVTGGRLTHAIADYFATVLRVVRPRVTLLSEVSSAWQTGLLDMGEGDVVVVFDVRRYETTMVMFAELAAQRGAKVVIVTDRWLSPATQHAAHTLACSIAVPSAWDSMVPILFLVEALIAAVQSRNWDDAQSRLKRLEDYFSQTRFFRRPR
ncbi:MAG: MurR/RpiR family transcriptional regulator [Rhodobacteraceae bacterium]|nr:MurR/RpiR family transcriptional regulator [Paracoccaceae bacterium]